VLQRYYNLSEEQTQYQINDRLSFQKFLGITLADKVPDKNTIWDFKEALNRNNGIEKLFTRFDEQLRKAGLVGSEGKIIDASFVDVPRQRNSREENEIIKAGGVPIAFGQNEHKLSQKDTDARWTKKGNEVHYGYKNHIKANSQHKLIEAYEISDASVHDSQVVEDLVDENDGSLHADSAYSGKTIEKVLAGKEIENQVHERAYRNHPLTEEQKVSNREKSKVRVRIEHIFGHMTQAMADGLKLRSIGIKRITAAVGLLNLVYNMARYEQIVRLNLA
jgi:transposase, IS5 family